MSIIFKTIIDEGDNEIEPLRLKLRELEEQVAKIKKEIDSIKCDWKLKLAQFLRNIIDNGVTTMVIVPTDSEADLSFVGFKGLGNVDVKIQSQKPIGYTTEYDGTYDCQEITYTKDGEDITINFYDKNALRIDDIYVYGYDSIDDFVSDKNNRDYIETGEIDHKSRIGGCVFTINPYKFRVFIIEPSSENVTKFEELFSPKL